MVIQEIKCTHQLRFLRSDGKVEGNLEKNCCQFRVLQKSILQLIIIPNNISGMLIFHPCLSPLISCCYNISLFWDSFLLFTFLFPELSFLLQPHLPGLQSSASAPSVTSTLQALSVPLCSADNLTASVSVCFAPHSSLKGCPFLKATLNHAHIHFVT